MSVWSQNHTFAAGFLAITSNTRHAERSDDCCPVLTPQPRAFSFNGFCGIAEMIRGPPGATSGVTRSVSADCLFRTHAHVLVWSIQHRVRAVVWDELPH